MNTQCINECQAYFNISNQAIDHLWSEGCVTDAFDPSTGEQYISFVNSLWCNILSFTDSILNYGNMCQDYCTLNQTFDSSDIESETLVFGLTNQQLMIIGGLLVVMTFLKK